MRIFPIFLIVLLVCALACVTVKADNTNLTSISGWNANYPCESSLNYVTVHTAGSASVYVAAGSPEIWTTFEANHVWRSVSPGDVVYFSAWVKSDMPSGSFPNGMLIGVDLYGSERIMEVHARTETWVFDNNDASLITKLGSTAWVPFGTDWSHITLEFTVPPNFFTHNDSGGTLANGPQQISGMIPWLAGNFRGGSAHTNIPCNLWFADTELYINPSSYPTPTPTPTPSPTPYPTPTPTPTPSPTEQPGTPVPYQDSGVLVLFGCGLMVLLYSNGDKKRRRKH